MPPTAGGRRVLGQRHVRQRRDQCAAGGPEVRETGLAAIVTTRFTDPTLDSLPYRHQAGNDLVSVGATVHQLINFSSS